VDPEPPKTGCAKEGAFGSWRVQEESDRALAQTLLGRVVLRLRRLVERMAQR